MSGLKPAVVGMIGASLISVGTTVFFPKSASLSVLSTKAFWISVALCILAVILSKKKVHPILIIVISAVLGILVGSLGLL